jgi:hypothetical protein
MRRGVASRRWVVAGVAAVAVAVVAFLLIGGDDDESDGKEVIGTDAERLRELAGAQGHPVYWAGPEGADSFEWTALPDGDVYVRYLTSDAEVGDPNPAYLTVGTYAVGNGIAAIERAARDPGARTFEVPDGGTGLVNESSPTSVYLAYPGSEFQIEVFHPDPAEALDLVKSGKIEPILP